MIDATSFGSMTIDGRTYHSDLIILPDGTVRDGWRRRSGHVLDIDDLADLMVAVPRLIVAGTGVSGRMRPAPALAGLLADRGVELITAPTVAATQIYNSRFKAVAGVGGCFHLTC